MIDRKTLVRNLIVVSLLSLALFGSFSLSVITAPPTAEAQGFGRGCGPCDPWTVPDGTWGVTGAASFSGIVTGERFQVNDASVRVGEVGANDMGLYFAGDDLYWSDTVSDQWQWTIGAAALELKDAAVNTEFTFRDLGTTGSIDTTRLSSISDTGDYLEWDGSGLDLVMDDAGSSDFSATLNGVSLGMTADGLYAARWKGPGTLGNVPDIEISGAVVTYDTEADAGRHEFHTNSTKRLQIDDDSIEATVGLTAERGLAVGTGSGNPLMFADSVDADTTITDTTPVNLITFAAEASDAYSIQCRGRVRSVAAATDGTQFSIDVPAGATMSHITCTTYPTSTSILWDWQTGDGTACGGINSGATAAQGSLYFTEGYVTMGAAGNIIVRAQSETTGDVTVMAGHRCEFVKVVNS